jgi:hypothetical protein
MKKNLLKTSMISVAAAVVIAMTGCGGGGSSSSSDSSSSSSGSASDGYIQHAKVCVDLNNNGTCDSGEPSTTTDENGYYSLVIPSGTETNKSTPLLVESVTGTTIDKDTGLEFNGTLKAPVEGTANITPLTTLVAVAIEEDPDLNITTAVTKVANSLGLEADDVTSDPVSLKQTKPEVFAKAMTIHRVVLMMTEATNDNNTSKIYNALAKTIKDDIVEKGAGISGLLKKAVSYLPEKAANIAKSDVASATEGLLKKALISQNNGEKVNFSKVAKDTVTTYVKNVADAVKNGVDIDKNLSILVQETVKDTVAKDKVTLKFGKTLRITKGDGTNYDVNLTDTLDTAMFKDDIDMNISDTEKVEDFNITLAGMDVNQSFTDTNASLSINIVDDYNESNKITISVPTVVIKYNDVNETNLTIPKNTTLTFSNSGNVNIVDERAKGDTGNKDLIFEGKEGNLTIDFKRIINNIGLSNDQITNLNKYLDDSRSYTVSVKIDDINNTNLFVPFTEVKGCLLYTSPSPRDS